jgi:choline dehydrogenase-like flavoprotein
MRIAVIGTGPAGLAAVSVLITRGIRPEVFDLAAEAEPAALDLRDRMARTAPKDWAPTDRSAAMYAPKLPARDTPRKRYFGSDYAYSDIDPVLNIQSEGPVPSRAFGGFSTVWGASVLPPNPEDLSAWPDKTRQFETGLQVWSKAMPMSGAPGRPSLPYGPQMSCLLDDVEKARGRVGVGIRMGPAHLAVAAVETAPFHPVACNACGMCLSGCPYGAIFETASRFRRLVDDGLVRLRASAQVTHVDELDGQARVRGVDLLTGRAWTEHFDRVLLGAGAMASARILLRSRPDYGSIVEMLDSQKMLLPLLRLKGPAGALERTGPTLAGAFVDLPPDLDRSSWAHLQITGVNPLLLQHLGIGPDTKRGLWRRRLLAPILARVMVGWAGLHSDHSGRIRLQVREDGTQAGTLTIKSVPRSDTEVQARRAVAQFAKVLRCTGTYLSPIGWRIMPPGEGNHVGGGFPMRDAPDGNRLYSDLLARPAGFKYVHLIDSAAFPSFPATTPTLLIMAHADRIARNIFE